MPHRGTACLALSLCLAGIACGAAHRAAAEGTSASSYVLAFQEYRKKGDLAGAERLARQAAAELTARFGAASPEVASALRLVTQALHDQRRYGEATVMIQRALEIDERADRQRAAVASDLQGLAELL